MDRKNLIIIPAFNETVAIEKTVMSLSGSGMDILVVNDGSSDNTKAIVESLQTRLPQLCLVSLPLNSGIGAAVQTGFLYARHHQYEYAIQFDGDGQHSADSLTSLLQHALDNDLDLCIGSRFLNITSFTSSPLRQVGIHFFSRLISVLSGVTVTDPTSGFRVYSKRAIARFAEQYPDDYPEPEALFWCARNKLKVGEFPVVMHARQGGQSSIRYLKTIYYMLKVSLAILIDRIRSREL
jgi:glycosyltransferase involved in cell wall biosynthesis